MIFMYPKTAIACRRRRGVAALCQTLILVLTPLVLSSAHAWGPAGHHAVGAVADHLLSPNARAVVERLLANDAEGHHGSHRSLADVASWPDQIRGRPGDHPHWHYDNIPVCHIIGQGSAWCHQQECASAQFDHQLAILSDERRPLAERAIALKWVVHLAGDLHQPLHAADLAEGANRIHVLSHHERSSRHDSESLHGFWDSRLVQMDLHVEHGDIPVRSLQHLLDRAQHIDAGMLQRGPLDWALESGTIAREFALRVDGINCALENTREPVEVRLTEEYVTQARHVVDDRLALASARLAHQLNQALSSGR
jgi:hypothetical protein